MAFSLCQNKTPKNDFCTEQCKYSNKTYFIFLVTVILSTNTSSQNHVNFVNSQYFYHLLYSQFLSDFTKITRKNRSKWNISIFFSFYIVKFVSIFCVRNKQLLVMTDDICYLPFSHAFLLSYLQIAKRSIFDNTHLFRLLGVERNSIQLEIFKK